MVLFLGKTTVWLKALDSSGSIRKGWHNWFNNRLSLSKGTNFLSDRHVVEKVLQRGNWHTINGGLASMHGNVDYVWWKMEN